MPSVFRTVGRHGYSVKFASFATSYLACATSQNYGITGNGTLFVLKSSPDDELHLFTTYDWQDGLFDVTWSELAEDIVVTAGGDGTIQIWSLTTPQVPVSVLKGHEKEIYSVDWSQTRREQWLISGSWDHTLKLWDPQTSALLSTFCGHSHVVYSSVWSPHIPNCFASTSADHTLKIWNPGKSTGPVISIPAHNSEVLCCDWCKYNKNVITTGGIDGLIRGWDLRQSQRPVFQLSGHQYAIRKLKFSPQKESVLVSVSYDYSTRVWDWKHPNAIGIQQNHTEFAYGLDFDIHHPNLVADCGWDELVCVFSINSS